LSGFVPKWQSTGWVTRGSYNSYRVILIQIYAFKHSDSLAQYQSFACETKLFLHAEVRPWSLSPYVDPPDRHQPPCMPYNRIDTKSCLTLGAHTLWPVAQNQCSSKRTKQASLPLHLTSASIIDNATAIPDGDFRLTNQSR